MDTMTITATGASRGNVGRETPEHEDQERRGRPKGRPDDMVVARTRFIVHRRQSAKAIAHAG
jgi:hypothetical protein